MVSSACVLGTVLLIHYCGLVMCVPSFHGLNSEMERGAQAFASSAEMGESHWYLKGDAESSSASSFTGTKVPNSC